LRQLEVQRACGTEELGLEHVGEGLHGAKERLELAVGGANLAEWDYDLESNAIYLGSEWAGLLGRRPVAGIMSGVDVNDLVHPDDRPAVRNELVAGLKGRKTMCEVECRVRTADGAWRWVHAKGQVTERNKAGRATRASGTLADIHERKRAEAALRETERRYRALVELSPDGILFTSDGVIEFANSAAARILGAPDPQGLLGMRGDELMRAGQRDLESASATLAAGGRAVVLTVFRDVTESRQARQALVESEQRFRAVAEVSGEYVWETDAAWRYSYLSERVEAVLGYGRGELLGRRAQEIMPLGEERAVQEWLAQHAPGGRPFRELVHRVITKSRGVIWQSVSAVPVRDAAGRFIGYRGTAADVTPRPEGMGLFLFFQNPKEKR